METNPYQSPFEADRTDEVQKMTVRENLDRQLRISKYAALGGWLLFPLGILLAIVVHVGFLLILISGLIIFVGALLYMLLGVRCPRCRGLLGSIMSSTVRLPGVSSKIQFCPFCGVDLDSELMAEEASKKG